MEQPVEQPVLRSTMSPLPWSTNTLANSWTETSLISCEEITNWVSGAPSPFTSEADKVEALEIKSRSPQQAQVCFAVA